MNGERSLPPGFSERDIFFECPRCGKSLGIDERGAGLVVRCPDCGLRMQVPMPDTGEPEVRADQSLVGYPDVEMARQSARTEAERVNYRDEDAHERRRQLEKMRLDYLARFERIREEIALIQAGLDRMVDILQDVAIRPPPEGR